MERFVKANASYPVITGVLPTLFESEVDACDENKIRIRVLSNSDNKQGKLLAEKLSGCNPDEPCQSFACAECVRRFRIKKINQLVHFCEAYKAWSVVTIVYYDEMVPSLFRLNLPRLKDRLRKQLNRAGVENVMIGCFEADYHPEYEYWMPHFHLLVKNAVCNSIEWINFRKNHAKHQKTDGIEMQTKRPVLFQRLKDPAEQIAYIYKVMWQQVDAFYYDERRYTKKYRLGRNRFVSSLLKLDSFKLSDIEFMYRLRQYGTTLKYPVRGKK